MSLHFNRLYVDSNSSRAYPVKKKITYSFIKTASAYADLPIALLLVIHMHTNTHTFTLIKIGKRTLFAARRSIDHF